MIDFPHIINSILVILATIIVYQAIAKTQQKFKLLILQPMLLTIAIVICILLYFNIDFKNYYQHSLALNAMLEPAVVALGFPLYQHLGTIGKQWKSIFLVLTIGVIIAVSISFILTMLILAHYALAVALSLKSVTTPIAIALAQQLDGNIAITAFAIIIAGFSGAYIGPPWLRLLKVDSPKAMGLAIGTASHAIGTATISNISYEHAAYSSLSLIVSAVTTAILSPVLITYLSLYIIS